MSLSPENLITAKQLANKLFITKRAVLKRAQREHWPYTQITTKGGATYYFYIDQLPKQITAFLNLDVYSTQHSQSSTTNLAHFAQSSFLPIPYIHDEVLHIIFYRAKCRLLICRTLLIFLKSSILNKNSYTQFIQSYQQHDFDLPEYCYQLYPDPQLHTLFKWLKQHRQNIVFDQIDLSIVRSQQFKRYITPYLVSIYEQISQYIPYLQHYKLYYFLLNFYPNLDFLPDYEQLQLPQPIEPLHIRNLYRQRKRPGARCYWETFYIVQRHPQHANQQLALFVIYNQSNEEFFMLCGQTISEESIQLLFRYCFLYWRIPDYIHCIRSQSLITPILHRYFDVLDIETVYVAATIPTNSALFTIIKNINKQYRKICQLESMETEQQILTQLGKTTNFTTTFNLQSAVHHNNILFFPQKMTLGITTPWARVFDPLLLSADHDGSLYIVEKNRLFIEEVLYESTLLEAIQQQTVLVRHDYLQGEILYLFTPLSKMYLGTITIDSIHMTQE